MPSMLAAFILLGLFSLILISIVFWSVKNGISPMPSSGKARKAILELIPKNYTGNIYELGSGWGTLVISLAKMHPDCLVIGYETSSIPYYVSRVLKWYSGLSNIRLLKKDFFEISLSDAPLVVCYLYPGAMGRLKSKFENELKPGAIVISNTFACPGWTAEHVAEIDDLYKSKVYFYKR